ncbi:CDP-alcohol phosphatidyltransferase family protein [Streptomyces sp. CRN 30]|uniref:CDP-alcohol phosphatidyltransferase family protein n=1 Tax=Streptomyces sp. CRN 30 TaxID=3075613 RepID=UPI002A83130B|nr:CDP-alcohol phosphatidyltransferase family protein [Streptomyces sp. CRN 30]
MDIPPLAEVRRLTEKRRDAWWTVLLVDPVATPLVRWTARWPRITPNGITWAALVMGLAAAACFAQGDRQWLIIGAIVYHVSFILDCMDGKLARLTGRGSEFGAWLDYVFDRVRVLICAIALMGGQYAKTGNVAFVWLALAVVFLDMLRYIDALQIFKVRQGMKKKLDDAAALNGTAPAAPASAFAAMDGTVGGAVDGADDPADALPVSKPASTLMVTQQSFIRRFTKYERIRDYLIAHRIRTHLVSGIEFQMAVFIIAPLAGAIMWTTIGAGALLLLFEFAIIYKLLLSTKDFERTMASFKAQASEAPQETPAMSR